MFTIRRALRSLPIPKFGPRPLRDRYRRRPKSFESYLPDWLLTATLGLLIVLLNHVDGFRREFDLTDPSIAHRYKPNELVPGYALHLISFVAPLLIMWSINLAVVRSWWDAHSAALGNLLHRCQPVPGATNHPPNEFFGLATWAVCTQTDQLILRDGWRSFWSGHASGSFAGLSFLSYYMAGKLHMFDEQGYTAKVWAALAPLLVALLVAISRTVDNRHHWQDVTVGAIVGMNLAYFAYRQYYPSLADKLSHEAYRARLSPFERDMPRDEPEEEEHRDEENAPLIENYSDRGTDSPRPTRS